jgi:hypothetical protein
VGGGDGPSVWTREDGLGGGDGGWSGHGQW